MVVINLGLTVNGLIKQVFTLKNHSGNLTNPLHVPKLQAAGQGKKIILWVNFFLFGSYDEEVKMDW